MTNPSAIVRIDASRDRVWAVHTEPDRVAVWLHGTDMVTTWQVGSPITWSGTYDGHAYTDRGEVLVVDPPRLLTMTHYSPLMGAQDRPENYHTGHLHARPPGHCHALVARPGRVRRRGSGRAVQCEMAADS